MTDFFACVGVITCAVAGLAIFITPVCLAFDFLFDHGYYVAAFSFCFVVVVFSALAILYFGSL